MPAIYIEPVFLDDTTCRRIRRAMDAGVIEDAEILDGDIAQRDDIRRALSVEIDPSSVEEIEALLDGRREAIAKFFRTELADREGAGFLRYRSGGFYAPHVDRADIDAWPGAARRAIAVVAFLNGSRESEPEGEFSGGILRLYADDGDVEVKPRRGQLVAFPADLLHEVTEVIDGTRDAIVDWFYSP
jgi:predicted 2-oxoglutarate/Fe(II)-dependent dioxygenase YbiX